LGGNSTVDHVERFSYSYAGGNTRFSYSYSGGNVSDYAEQFSYSYLGGNSTVDHVERFSYSYSGGNESEVAQWTERFSYSYSGGNATTYAERFSYSYAGGNTSVRTWTERFSYSYSGGNILDHAEQFSYSYSGGNSSVDHVEQFSYSYAGGNTSVRAWTERFSYSYSGGNILGYVERFSYSYSGGNESDPDNRPPFVSNIIPLNNSEGNLLNMLHNLTVDDPDLDIINATWYNNVTNPGVWVLFGTNFSINPGGQIVQNHANATSFNKRYWIKCIVNDTEDDNSSIFGFTTMNFNASFSFNTSHINAGEPFTLIDESGGNATHIEWRINGNNRSHKQQGQGGGHGRFNYNRRLNLSSNYTVGMYIRNSEGNYQEWKNVSLDVDRNISYSKTNNSVGYNYIAYHQNGSTTASQFATNFGVPDQQWVHKYNTSTGSWESWWVGMSGTNFDINTWDIVIVSSMLNTTVQVNISEPVNFTQSTTALSGYNYYCWSNGTSCSLNTAASAMGLQTGDWIFKYNTNNGTWSSYWVGYTGDDVTVGAYDVLVCNVGASRNIFITDEELGDGL
jgi:hypothetical protein